MTLLALAFMGILTAIVMASEGNFSGLAIVVKILLYIVIGCFALWFLAVTGWGGLILIVFIAFAVAIKAGLKG